MSRKDTIEQRTEELLIPIAEAHQVVIYDVEYVKEAGEMYLRAYIDKEGPESVDINTCVDVSRALSDALDAEDYIEEAYTLEVSSPGLGRQLKKDRHLAYSIGQEVEVKLYKPVDGEKSFVGILEAFDRETITIGAEDKSRVFPRKEISTVRLTLDL